MKNILDSLGVALNVSYLRHLVLSGKDEIEVLKRTAAFLTKNNRGEINALFHLSKQKATFDILESYGRKYLKNLWDEEKKDANHRVEKHWKEVQEKQALSAKLRAELSALKNQLRQREREKDSAQRYFRNCANYDCNYYRQKLNEAEQSRYKAQNEVQSKARQLKGTTKS